MSEGMDKTSIINDMAQNLRTTSDKYNSLEQSMAEKNKEMAALQKQLQEMKELENKLRQMEEQNAKSKDMLQFYQQQEQNKLKAKYDNVVLPFVSKLKEELKDNTVQAKQVSDFEQHLSSQINNKELDPDVIKSLEPTFSFVESCASSSQIRASQYEAFHQKQQKLKKDLEERDLLIKKKTEESEELAKKLEEVEKLKNEELVKLKEEREAELAKMKEELDKYQKSLKDAKEDINNTNEHVQKMDTDEDEKQQVPEKMQTGAPDAGLYDNGILQEQSYVSAVAGSTGVGSFNDLLKIQKQKNDSWRQINTRITKDMYSENIRNAFKRVEGNQ